MIVPSSSGPDGVMNSEMNSVKDKNTKKLEFTMKETNWEQVRPV